MAVVVNGTGGQFHQTRERSEGRRLPRPVGPDERDDAPLWHMQAHAVQRFDRAVGDVKIFDREQGGGVD